MAHHLPAGLGRRVVVWAAGSRLSLGGGRRQVVSRRLGDKDVTVTVAARDYDRRRGLAIWASEMAASAPRRFCRHWRATEWQVLGQGPQAGGGQLVLTADPMWAASVCALALFHRPVVLVADPARYGEATELPDHGALAGRWRRLDGVDVDAVSRLLGEGETVVWVLASNDLGLASDGGSADDPAWARVAVQGTAEVFWLRAQPESEAAWRFIVESLPVVSRQIAAASRPIVLDVEGWVAAAAAQLHRSLAVDPLAFPWDLVVQGDAP